MHTLKYSTEQKCLLVKYQEINRLKFRLEDNESFLKFLNQCVSPRNSQRTK